jgi:Xaa-Pro dipeptidase
MKNVAMYKKVKSIVDENHLDALVLGGTYNIQYATGVHIPCAHAQTDLVMFAVFAVGKEPMVLVPKCWESVARQTCYFTNVRSYGLDNRPLEMATAALVDWCQPAKRIGTDDGNMSVTVNAQLAHAFERAGVTLVPCKSHISKARSIKTDEEVALLTAIAYKTDHVINGHFHHLSADRPKTASSISESLRIHSQERDIEISGYNACSRAVLGESLSKFWAYAPKYGFADCEMTKDNDTIIAHVLNTENGYWSNATRMAISSDRMSDEQERMYAALNQLRDLLLSSLRIGRKCSDIYHEMIEHSKKESLSLVNNIPLGFCVGVSPMEGPFLSPGEEQTVEASMVLVLNPVVKYGTYFYRSSDTVVIKEDGPEVVNWYKDWREPYLAILAL